MNTDSGFSLSAMVIAQVAIAMAVMTVPVLAPQIAADIEIEASQVGLYSATVFVGAIVFTSVAGSVIARHGSIRTTQIAMVLGAAGLLLALGGWLPALLIGAFAAGMGYGVATPAASHLLARTISRENRGFVFSLKQTGVPIGGFLLGITVPGIADAHGWPWGIAAVVTVLLIVAVGLQTARRRFDTDRDPSRPIRPGETLAAIRMVARDSRLRPLALASFVYAMMQLSLFTFYVVVLVERGGLDPVAAGATFSIMHIGGIIGRPFLGWISDRILPARPLLSLIGFLIFGCGLALAALDESWPRALLWAVSLGAGIVAAGWNGVYIGEIARIMPGPDVARATGGVSAFTFLGVAIGPAIFSAIVGFSGSYVAGFLTVGGVALIPALILLRSPPEIVQADILDREETET
ncbi:MAG: MFS transporter [Alphaproteobacteria bacterium]|nr:MFS transporter [Alphaproteobacteria bacterium]